MKIKGICKDCKHRWQMGAKGNPKHLFCKKQERNIKNINMQQCKDYEKADEKYITILNKMSRQ